MRSGGQFAPTRPHRLSAGALMRNGSIQRPVSIRGVLADRRGGVAVLFALTMPLLIGFAALATEVGGWYLQRRTLQTIADVAAMSAAYELLAGSGEEEAAALQEAALHGFSPGSARDLRVTTPPDRGASAGDDRAVQVQIQERRVLLFVGLFRSEPVLIEARAVARVSASDSACVLALDQLADRAVDVTGTADLTLDGCTLAANSRSTEAIAIRGNGSLSALSLATAGGFTVSGSATLETVNPARTGIGPIADPYGDRDMPEPDDCLEEEYKQTSKTPTQLVAGTYCGGISLGGQSVVDLEPGLYILDGGSLTINAGARVTCTGCTGDLGVTFLLTGSDDVATVRINGDADISLRAPTTGPFAGLLFFQDRAAAAGGDNLFNGGATMSLAGALYFPAQEVAFRGNSSLTGSRCLQIVARIITFAGTSGLGSDCSSGGTDPIIVGGAVALVE